MNWRKSIKLPSTKSVSMKSFVRYSFLILVALIFVFPVYLMFVVSIQSPLETSAGLVFPSGVYAENWIQISTQDLWVSAIRNSLIISISSVIVGLLVSFPAAYGFSRSKFIADKHLFFWLLTNRMTPAVVFILAYIAMFRAIGIWDTLPGVVLAYCTFNLPLAIWLMVGFMNSIPKDIDEAAFIDGYSLTDFFRRVLIPLSKPGIAVTAFFIWMFSWAEMFMASTLTSVSAKTLPVQLLVTVGRVGYAVEYGVAAAAGVVTIIPGLVLLYWARTYLAKGFSFGRV